MDRSPKNCWLQFIVRDINRPSAGSPLNNMWPKIVKDKIRSRCLQRDTRTAVHAILYRNQKENVDIGFIRTCKKKGQRDCKHGRAEKAPALSINYKVDMAGEKKTSRQVKWNCVSGVGYHKKIEEAWVA